MNDLELLKQAAPALTRLPAEALDVLGRALTRRTLGPGEYLFRQGEGPPGRVYHLISATVEIRVGAGDDERVVSVSGPGDLVGWLSVFAPEPFPASARVAAPGEALEIPTAVLRDLASRHPEVGSLLAASMARRLQDLFLRVREEARSGALAGRADAAAFRRRVVEVMSAPPVRVTPWIRSDRPPNPWPHGGPGRRWWRRPASCAASSPRRTWWARSWPGAVTRTPRRWRP
nr:Crp/Fnr family transcriptional regulator [Deferrisoma camini]